MKLGPKINKAEQWHRWFAWYPVDCCDGRPDLRSDRRWWEWVERREIPGMAGTGDMNGWIYRPVGEGE